MLTFIFTLLPVLLLASAPDSAGSPENVVVVQLTGFSSIEGFARLAVFDSEEFWPEDIDFAVRRVTAGLTADTLEMVIEGLEPGSYSMAVFHDRDGDAVFDRNLFGVPTEDYGFSNNVRGRTGPPDFLDALVVLTGDTLRLEIELK